MPSEFMLKRFSFDFLFEVIWRHKMWRALTETMPFLIPRMQGSDFDRLYRSEVIVSRGFGHILPLPKDHSSLLFPKYFPKSWWSLTCSMQLSQALSTRGSRSVGCPTMKSRPELPFSRSECKMTDIPYLRISTTVDNSVPSQSVSPSNSWLFPFIRFDESDSLNWNLTPKRFLASMRQRTSKMSYWRRLDSQSTQSTLFRWSIGRWVCWGQTLNSCLKFSSN